MVFFFEIISIRLNGIMPSFTRVCIYKQDIIWRILRKNCCQTGVFCVFKYTFYFKNMSWLLPYHYRFKSKTKFYIKPGNSPQNMNKSDTLSKLCSSIIFWDIYSRWAIPPKFLNSENWIILWISVYKKFWAKSSWIYTLWTSPSATLLLQNYWKASLSQGTFLAARSLWT